ncbi:hypothetical protein BU15DRAFT_76775 [Melanogaster broomeanus]|nr:hypothetical protein BU15DRAFT_76775 [Melanogaster broomeanus]
MSPDPQFIFATTNYLSVVFVTVIAYDYILTFPGEVNYVWSKPWTRMSTLFLLVRYLGPFYSISSDLCTILYQVANWPGFFFTSTANLVMLLRVCAMYNRSRIVLGFLLVSYIPSVVVNLVASWIEFEPQINVTELFGVKICTLAMNVPGDFTIYGFTIYYYTPEIILNALICSLAVVRFVRESLQMHRAIKQWRSNRYLELLVQESMLYFVVNLSSLVVSMVLGVGTLQGLTPALLYTFSRIVPIVLPARLIISIREFHSRIVGDHIDTGFGAISHQLISTNENMVFANGEGPTESIRDRRSAEETSGDDV